MSLLEILVVIIVSLLVIKPEDLPKIFGKIREIKAFITSTKQEIMLHLDPVSELNESILENFDQDMDMANFYLEKIANLGIEYKGDYSLAAIKEYYHGAMQDKVKQIKANNE